MARLGAGTVAVASLVAGAAVVAAPVADAAPVPYAVGFDDSTPAIAPGGDTLMYLDCPGSEGVAVPVTVTDPSAAVSAFAILPVVTSGTPTVFVRVGAGGTFTATELGTWSVSVACPGFDAYVSSFEVLAPTLGLDVHVERNGDCATVEDAFLPGDRELACLTVTNNTGMDLRRIVARTASSASFSYPGAGEVGPGATFVTAAGAGIPADLAGGSMEGLTVWAELDTPNSGLFAVAPTQSVDYGPLGPPIGLTATTGLTAGAACADQGGLANRTVAPGTPVYLCYTMTNTSGVVYHFHDIGDSVLGSLFTALENDVDTYETMTVSPAQPLVPTTTETHTGTWSSTVDDGGYTALPDGYVATATATATITVTAAPRPTTTTTPTPTTAPAPRPVLVIATPAVAVKVEPHLAG